MRKYFYAFIAALLLIAAGGLFARYYSSEKIIEREYHSVEMGESRYSVTFEQFKASRKSRQVNPFLPSDRPESLEISEFLGEHWQLSILAAFVLCFGVAFLLGVCWRNSLIYKSTLLGRPRPQKEL